MEILEVDGRSIDGISSISCLNKQYVVITIETLPFLFFLSFSLFILLNVVCRQPDTGAIGRVDCSDTALDNNPNRKQVEKRHMLV